MESINVLITRTFTDDQVEKLRNVSPRLNIMSRPVEAAEDFAGGLMDEIEVLYAAHTLPRPEDAPRLRWVQLHSAGADHIVDEPLFTDTDIAFTTTSGIHTINMAEYTMAQILSYAHHLPEMFEDKQDGTWPEDRWGRYLPDELHGMTLGIIGYGSIGREIARQAQVFGMTVLAIKSNLRELSNDHTFRVPGTGDPDAEIPDRIYPVEALHSVLKESDYVVLTVPLTEDTHHMIDADALAAMKSSAVLINIARGGVVDEPALVDALQQGTIRAAALDVFEEEPLPEDSPLWQLPNVTISPHISGLTPYYDERATDLFADNLRRFVAGEPLLNVVSRSRGY